MKLTQTLLLLALSVLALSGVIPLYDFSKTPNPNNIWKQVQFLPFNALEYVSVDIDVDITLIKVGYHAVAYNQVKALYPQYSSYPVSRCTYSTLGLLRLYTFDFDADSKPKAKTTIQTASEETESDDSSDESPDHKEGFERISVDWAQKDPTISTALNIVITRNFNLIRGNPITACWSRARLGLYTYRFYFNNVVGYFQHDQGADSKKTIELTYSDVAPVFTVSSSNEPSSNYRDLTLAEFKSNKAYSAIVAELNKELGKFDERWIINFQVAIINNAQCYKVVINFQPFLLKQKYEAYYYGSIQKAALLKIDEEVFNGNGKSFEDWQSIESFKDYPAFHNANGYVLSQFTWLRFYKVVSAYSALHLTGRIVRIVYAGIAANNIDPSNQINIVVFIDSKGCYFIDRNDFLATSTLSYGRNDWISLFIKTPDVTKAKYYTQIVKFFQSIYPKFWSANQLVDIKFKDNLHIVQFKNPTNLCNAVLNVDEKNTVQLNKVNWTKLEENSPLIGSLEKYVTSRFKNIKKIMFIQYLSLNNGTHFEVNFLDEKNNYNAVYILYIPATNVFTDDNTYFYEPQTYSSDPLPTDVKGSLSKYLADQDDSLLAVISFVSLSPNSFAIIALGETGRWQITVSWANSCWNIVSRQPYSDGYNRVRGYPSSLIASSTGFLARLYPAYFSRNYIYASIETRSVGINLYTRNVYSFGQELVEAVVQSISGVVHSQVLNQWQPISALRLRKDYGYGTQYSFSYNVDSSLLYNGKENQPSKTNLSSEPTQKESIYGAPASCPKGTRRDIFTKHCVVIFGL